MGNLFGKKEKQNKKQPQQQQQSSYPTKSQFPSQKKELSEGEKMRMKLQHNRDELRNKRKQIDLQIDTYEKEIRMLIQSNKRDQAKFVLQRKLLYDKFLDNIMEKEQIIEKSIISVDQMQSDKEMADIINQTNQVMKDIQSSIDQDKLRDAFADMQEQKQKNEEMNQMYQQYKVGDEDEINELYGKYEQQVNNTQPKQQQKQQQFVPLPQQQYCNPKYFYQSSFDLIQNFKIKKNQNFIQSLKINQMKFQKVILIHCNNNNNNNNNNSNSNNKKKMNIKINQQCQNDNINIEKEQYYFFNIFKDYKFKKCSLFQTFLFDIIDSIKLRLSQRFYSLKLKIELLQDYSCYLQQFYQKASFKPACQQSKQQLDKTLIL